MTLILSDKDVREVCDIRLLVDDLERVLTVEREHGGWVVPERLSLVQDHTLFRVMPAVLPRAGLLGLKLFWGTPDRSFRYAVWLCSMSDAGVLAILDAAYLTAARTGATTGLATRYLARPDASSVGIIGSGLEAETNLLGMHAARPLAWARVYSPNEGRRQNFAERMSARLGCPVTAVSRPRDAVAETDMVLLATNTGVGGDVAYLGEWMEAGQHVVSIGSTSTSLRELDLDAFSRPDVVMLDAPLQQGVRESGDLAALLAKHPKWRASFTLPDVAAQGLSLRESPEQRTLFKSVGTAAQDLAAAASVYQAASRRGLGTDLPDITEPKAF
jgi:alanine dehydrogenase